MKPVVIVQIINLSFVVVWYLISDFVLDNLQLWVFFAGAQTLFNLAAALVMMMDRKKTDNSIVNALFIGFGIMVVISIILWFTTFQTSGPVPALEVPA